MIGTLVLCVQSSCSFQLLTCTDMYTCNPPVNLTTDASTWLEGKSFASTCHHRMVAEPLNANITANTGASKRGRIALDQLSWRQ